MDNEAKEIDIAAFEVAIGYEISKLLSLKVNKIGHIQTTWGSKTVRGLGVSILRIIEEQTEKGKIKLIKPIKT